jgi:hypothetical protein
MVKAKKNFMMSCELMFQKKLGFLAVIAFCIWIGIAMSGYIVIKPIFYEES